MELLVLDLGLCEPLGQRPMSTWRSAGKIIKLSISQLGVTSKVLAGNQALPDGIDTCDGRMYWSNMGMPSHKDGTVLSARLDGSDVRTVISSGRVHTPKQICIDSTARKLYVCDREGHRILRCNLDGTELETVVQTADSKTVTDESERLRAW